MEVAKTTTNGGKTANRYNSHRNCNIRIVCDVCKFSFSSKYSMLKHKENVHDGKRIRCEHCAREYGSMGSYRAHVKKHKADYIKPTFTCHNCSKIFASKRNLRVHLENHSGLQQLLKCDLCVKKFKCADSLRVHKKEKHSDEKIFVCEICGKIYGSQPYLDGHKKIVHFKAKPVKPVGCKLCANTYKTEKSLREHIMHLKHPNEMKKIKHEKNPEVCWKCESRFRSVKHLKNHIKRMHGKKMF